MQLHLTIPGLLWPGEVLHNTTYDLELPAFSWLLGRGQLSWQPPRSLESSLCHAFGIEQTDSPVAALRLLGEAGNPDPGTDIWLCADPVHLRVEKGRMGLSFAAPKATAEEMQQIVAALAPFLAELGDYHAGIAGRAYLRLKEMPKLITLPPSAASGEGTLLPEGEEAPFWRRLGNEMQMLLHALPLNEQRELAGRPALNSLWFWGAGTLPTRRNCRYDLILGNDPLLAGLASWAEKPRQAPPANLDDLLKMSTTSAFLLLDKLQAPLRQFDAFTWRDALSEIDRDWLQPVRPAMLSGRLKSLRLTALGDKAGFDLTLTRRDLLRFWQRPIPLHKLSNMQTT